jgi:hypothetical protein
MIVTGIVLVDVVEPLVPVTTMAPVPLAAEDEATTEMTTFAKPDDTVTVDGEEEHEIPESEDESQPTFTLPEKPPVPYRTQLRVVVTEDLDGSAGTIKGSSSQSTSNPDTASGIADAHTEDGPKQASLDPFGMTI